jgi:hypothetical protein
MLSCNKCGSELPDDANFCYKCGKPTAKTVVEEVEVKSDELIKKVKELLHEGNVTKLIVLNEKEETLLEIPVTVSIVGALIAPWLAALGTIAAIATKCTIKVEKKV